MSWDDTQMACKDCGMTRFECECNGVQCGWCMEYSHDIKRTADGDFCSDCYDKAHDKCAGCHSVVFIPEAYIITKLLSTATGEEEHTHFCDQNCANEWAEWKFQKRWV